MHGELGRGVVPMLAQRKALTADSNRLKEPFPNQLHEEWMMPVVEFIHWFVAAGFGVPLLHNDPRLQYPITFRLTERGHRLLSASEDHPVLPGAAARMTARCPGMPAEVTSLIADSRECLDRMLLRPAVVMMGVAYELAIEHVAQALVNRGALTADVLDMNAARRTARLRGHVPTRFPERTDRENHYSVLAAYDFADRLRSRRNDASHTRPTYGFEDRAEVEELLVSAGRHLPSIWSLGT